MLPSELFPKSTDTRYRGHEKLFRSYFSFNFNRGNKYIVFCLEKETGTLS